MPADLSLMVLIFAGVESAFTDIPKPKRLNQAPCSGLGLKPCQPRSRLGHREAPQPYGPHRTRYRSELSLHRWRIAEISAFSYWPAILERACVLDDTGMHGCCSLNLSRCRPSAGSRAVLPCHTWRKLNAPKVKTWTANATLLCRTPIQTETSRTPRCCEDALLALELLSLSSSLSPAQSIVIFGIAGTQRKQTHRGSAHSGALTDTFAGSLACVALHAGQDSLKWSMDSGWTARTRSVHCGVGSWMYVLNVFSFCTEGPLKAEKPLLRV